MRIAVPIWEDRISPVLDTASRLLIVEKEEQQGAIRSETPLEEQDIHRRCLRIKGLGIDTLICGAVSRCFLRMLMASGIQIIYGVSGNHEDVLAAYFDGTLDHAGFLMPGFKTKKLCWRDQVLDFGKEATVKGKKRTCKTARRKAVMKKDLDRGKGGA